MASLAERENKKNSHSEKSYSNLQHLPNFKKLSKGDKRFLQTFYPKRHICRSTLRLGLMYKCSRASARETLETWERKTWIEREHRYHTNKDGTKTKIYKSNYYHVSKKGEKYLKKLLDFVFETVKNQKSNEFTQAETISNIFYTRHLSITTVIKNEPGESLQTSRSFSFEEKKVSLEKSSKISLNLTKTLQTLRGQVFSGSLRSKNLYPLDPKDKDSFKKCHKFLTIQKLFKSYGYFQLLDIAHRGTLLILLTLKEKDIKKLLKLIRRKLTKGWKLRSFWGFFMSEVRKLPDKRRFGDPWFKMLSKEYRDAFDGKKNRLTDGVDTNIFIQGVNKLERETGEKVPEKTLERMLYNGIQKLKTAVDAICYRLDLGKGELPKEKALEEESKCTPKGRPIFKQVKINLETKKPYTDEDFLADKPFSFTSKIVGYEPINEQPKQVEKPKSKKTFTKINSWIGMTFFSMKLGSAGAIHKAFFEKREATA